MARPEGPRDVRRGEVAGEGGVAANNRLTALTGALLAVLFVLLGLTVLDVHQLLPQHIILGLIAVPPVLLKLASTGYRFWRYYAGEPPYRAAGPPRPSMRLLAPLVVASTLAVLATGVELWLFGLRFGSEWVALHRLSFLAWLAFVSIHALSYFGKTADVTAEELSGRPDRAPTRRALVVGSLIVGAVIAAAGIAYPSPLVFLGD